MGLWRRGAVSCGGSCRLLPVRRRLHGRVTATRRGHGGGAGLARARRRAGLGPRRVVRGRLAPARHGDPEAAPGAGAAARAARWPGSARSRGRHPASLRSRLGRCTGPARGQPAWSSSTCRRCGRARCAATSWPAPAPRWSRSSRRSGPTARGAARAILRPVERAQTIRRPRLAEPDGVRILHAPRPAGRRRDRGEPSACAGAARDGRSATWCATADPRSGSPSPATGAPATRPTGSRSATTPPPRAGWSSGRTRVPLFCADAVADPLTGLTAADACLERAAAGGRWLLDVSMAAVSAGLSGPTMAVSAGARRGPAARRGRSRRTAPALGADTAHVLAELGIDPEGPARPEAGAYGTTTGNDSHPRTVDVCACTALSQSTSQVGKRCRTSSSAMRPSNRARWLPRQKWIP